MLAGPGSTKITPLNINGARLVIFTNAVWSIFHESIAQLPIAYPEQAERCHTGQS